MLLLFLDFYTLKYIFKIASVVSFSLISTSYGTSAQAQTEAELLDTIKQYSQIKTTNTIHQVTSVNQLRDVSPTDWSYEAIRSLVDRYGCLSGFPDGTFKGDRPITRYEFAAGLNSCFEQIERSIVNKPNAETQLSELNRNFSEIEQKIEELGGRTKQSVSN